MRPYQKYTDKALLPILNSTIESLEEYGIDGIDDYSDFSEIMMVVAKVLDSYGISDDFEDVTFFLGLLQMNPELRLPLQRPTLKRYDIRHTYEKVQTIRETYLNSYDSFIPVTKRMLMDLQSEGIYEPWDGSIIHDDVIDADYSDDWIDDIEEV